MSLIANKSNPHLSPTLPYLVTTPTSTCYYASTYLPLFSTQPATTQAPIWHYSQLNLLLRQHLPVTTQVQTCKHLSHSLFSTHAFQAPRTCLSTYENMLFLPIEHALLVPWKGPSPTHLITFWFHVVYKLHSRRYYTPILRIISSLPCSDFSHTSSSLSSAVTLCVIGWLNVSVDLGEFRYSVQLCERKNARGSLGVSSLTDFHRWTEAFLRTGEPTNVCKQTTDGTERYSYL